MYASYNTITGFNTFDTLGPNPWSVNNLTERHNIRFHNRHHARGLAPIRYPFESIANNISKIKPLSFLKRAWASTASFVKRMFSFKSLFNAKSGAILSGMATQCMIKMGAAGLAGSLGAGLVISPIAAGISVTGYQVYKDWKYEIKENNYSGTYLEFLSENRKIYLKKALHNSAFGLVGAGFVEAFSGLIIPNAHAADFSQADIAIMQKEGLQPLSPYEAFTQKIELEPFNERDTGIEPTNSPTLPTPEAVESNDVNSEADNIDHSNHESLADFTHDTGNEVDTSNELSNTDDSTNAGIEPTNSPALHIPEAVESNDVNSDLDNTDRSNHASLADLTHNTGSEADTSNELSGTDDSTADTSISEEVSADLTPKEQVAQLVERLSAQQIQLSEIPNLSQSTIDGALKGQSWAIKDVAHYLGADGNLQAARDFAEISAAQGHAQSKTFLADITAMIGSTNEIIANITEQKDASSPDTLAETQLSTESQTATRNLTTLDSNAALDTSSTNQVIEKENIIANVDQPANSPQNIGENGEAVNLASNAILVELPDGRAFFLENLDDPNEPPPEAMVSRAIQQFILENPLPQGGSGELIAQTTPQNPLITPQADSAAPGSLRSPSALTPDNNTALSALESFVNTETGIADLGDTVEENTGADDNSWPGENKDKSIPSISGTDQLVELSLSPEADLQ